MGIGVGINLWNAAVYGDGGGVGVPIAQFTDDPYTVGDTSIIVQVSNATIGATWAIAVNSTGGGTEVTDTGTVASASFQIDLDISGLSAGTVDLSYTEDAVEVSTDTALIEASQAGSPIGLLLILTKAA